MFAGLTPINYSYNQWQHSVISIIRNALSYIARTIISIRAAQEWGPNMVVSTTVCNVRALELVPRSRYELWSSSPAIDMSSGARPLLSIWALERVPRSRYELWSSSSALDMSSGARPPLQIWALELVPRHRYELWSSSSALDMSSGARPPLQIWALELVPRSRYELWSSSPALDMSSGARPRSRYELWSSSPALYMSSGARPPLSIWALELVPRSQYELWSSSPALDQWPRRSVLDLWRHVSHFKSCFEISVPSNSSHHSQESEHCFLPSTNFFAK